MNATWEKTGCDNTIHLSNVTDRHLLHKEYFQSVQKNRSFTVTPPSHPRVPVHEPPQKFIPTIFQIGSPNLVQQWHWVHKNVLNSPFHKESLHWKEYNPTTVLEGNSSNTFVMISRAPFAICPFVTMSCMYVCVFECVCALAENRVERSRARIKKDELWVSFVVRIHKHLYFKASLQILGHLWLYVQ